MVLCASTLFLLKEPNSWSILAILVFLLWINPQSGFGGIDNDQWNHVDPHLINFFSWINPAARKWWRWQPTVTWWRNLRLVNSIGSCRWDSTLIYKIPSWNIKNGWWVADLTFGFNGYLTWSDTRHHFSYGSVSNVVFWKFGVIYQSNFCSIMEIIKDMFFGDFEFRIGSDSKLVPVESIWINSPKIMINLIEF